MCIRDRSKVEKLQDEYKKIQASIQEVTTTLKPTTEVTETPSPELTQVTVPTKPAEDNFEAVEQNLSCLLYTSHIQANLSYRQYGV